MKQIIKVSQLLFAVALYSTSILAHAALGERADSIESDVGRLNLIHTDSRSIKTFRYEELAPKDLSKQIKVRQFVSNSGDVFGVAWTGRMDSQLSQFLGSYADDFAKQELEHPPRTGRIPYRKVTAGKVVVEFWDSLRRVQGKAYIPAMLPAKVVADDINMNR